MKGGSNLFIVFLLLTALQGSCMSGIYCENCESAVDDQFVSIEENARFEIEEFEFIHDLWSKTGHLGCKVKNISAFDLTIDLTKTLYASTRLATPYFSDSEIIYPTGASAFSAIKIYSNPRVIVVLPNRYSLAGGFWISNGYINDCDFKPYPFLKDSTYFVCDIDNIPVVFSNMVSYESEGETYRVEHESYTSRVTNLTEAKALKAVCRDELGNKLYVSNNAFALGGPSSFY
jgi:hypothetical protein